MAPCGRTNGMMRVVLAQPRGFCAGVERAIEIVERALKKYGPPIYVRHEIVHNRHVVEDLRHARRRVRRRTGRDPGRRAHRLLAPTAWPSGSSRLAAARGLPVIDATCPLVAKVHNEGRRYAAQGREIVLVGHAGHAEVEGTIGQVPGQGASGADRRGRGAAGGRRPGQAGLYHPDHAVGGRHARHHRGAEGSGSRPSSGRTCATSAMPRRTASRRCASWPGRWT